MGSICDPFATKSMQMRLIRNKKSGEGFGDWLREGRGGCVVVTSSRQTSSTFAFTLGRHLHVAARAVADWRCCGGPWAIEGATRGGLVPGWDWSEKMTERKTCHFTPHTTQGRSLPGGRRSEPLAIATLSLRRVVTYTRQHQAQPIRLPARTGRRRPGALRACSGQEMVMTVGRSAEA